MPRPAINVVMASNDMELLREYAASRSESAFTELVSRHLNWVYSTAWRQTGDADLAEEIAQAVFIVLARKAASLGSGTVLSGWLYRTACFAAKDALRARRRRQHHEQEASKMQSTFTSPEAQTGAGADTAWQELAPLLDEAMTRLGSADRDALVLRFFEGKSLPEVGAALGASDEAAKKRVQRALEKLQKFFRQRGVTSSTAMLAEKISAHSVQIAPLSVAKVVAAATLAQGAGAGGSTLTIVKGALKLMAWTKIKTTVLAGVAALLAAGGLTIVVKFVAQPATATASDEIWNQYYQVLADNTNNSTLGAVGDHLMRSHPPMAAIRLTPMERRSRAQFRIPGVPGRASGWGTEHGHVALGMPLHMVLRYAYNLDPTNFPSGRIVMPPELADVPSAQSPQYDYIDTMPKGGREKLQQALKDQWGLVVRREMRQNLALRVKTPGASGLHPHGTAGNRFQANNVTMPRFAKELRLIFGVNVTDATGLEGGYDFTLDLPRPPKLEDLKKAIEDQLGLELTPATDDQGVEFIVVERPAGFGTNVIH
jgi:uncharacterized protein (TIGR03435 family)